MIHLPESLDDLKEICLKHGYLDDTAILLAGGILASSKSLSYTPGDKFAWEVYHNIDGTLSKYTDRTLARDTNIVEAINGRAFLVSIDVREPCGCPKST